MQSLTCLIHYRYLVVVLNGTKNPHRSGVAKDIRDAILKAGSTPESPAKYWSKEEQAVKLTAAYEKWEKVPGVWSAAAQKVRSNKDKHPMSSKLTE